ncbi:MAG TPA: hypothetical protein VK812_01365, partial [Candidatus Binatus sp.]|nr:hypothetical protein [Candidatus Binatus sp.]
MNSGKRNSSKRLAVTLFVLAQSFLASSLFAQEAHPAKSAAPQPAAEARLPLHDGWSLQTSAKVEAKGEV